MPARWFRKCFRNDIRRFRRYDQKRASRTVRVTTALLPVLKCRDADTDHSRELGLRFLKFLANRTNILRFEDELSRRSNLATMNLARFFDAFDQFVKELFFHLNSPLIRLRSVFFSSGERSSRSIFEYITSR